MKNKNVPFFDCVDDDPSADTFCEVLSESENGQIVNIKRRHPKDWEDEVATIISRMRKGEADGCLLDYRLDEKGDPATAPKIPPSAPKKKAPKKTPGLPVPVGYTADSVVQEVRRRSVEHKDISFPVVLWSNADQLEEFHDWDPHFRRHYDLVIDKEEIGKETTEKSKRLASLVTGYRYLRSLKGRLKSLSIITTPPAEGALSSIQSFFEKQHIDGAYSYQAALFIIHELLSVEGPLITPRMLDAILAISPEEIIGSKKYHAFIEPFRYKGVFADGYSRYWKIPLLLALDNLSGKIWLRLNAQERCDQFSKLVGLKKHTAIEPISPAYNTAYDTICAFTGRPLNRTNGYALFDPNPRTWKEQSFISADALRRNYGAAARKFRIAESEESRFKSLFKA